MAISVESTRNALATEYASLATHAGAHSDDTATSGNELAGSGYARGAISWGTASGSAIVGTATITLPTAGGTLASVGLWSASSSGTFRDGANVTDVVYSGPGTASVTVTYTQS